MTFVEAKGAEPGDSGARADTRPLLMVDIDGVLSLLGVVPPGAYAEAGGGPSSPPPEGSFHLIDGIPHFLSATAAAHLLGLAPLFDIVWASGWEERADEHLPHLLGLPRALPHLRFPANVRGRRTANAHWKLDAIDAYARGRPLAWIDDALNQACERWATARSAPTLLVRTSPELGLTEREERLLREWASRL